MLVKRNACVKILFHGNIWARKAALVGNCFPGIITFSRSAIYKINTDVLFGRVNYLYLETFTYPTVFLYPVWTWMGCKDAVWDLPKYSMPKSCPSSSGPWYFNSENIWTIVNGEGQFNFDPNWLVPWIIHMMVGNLKGNFSCKESWVLSSNSKVKGFFVRPLSELHVSSRIIYVINTDMAVSLADLTAFFQDEGKSIERGENH